jgi:hypothetical protein
MMQFDNFLSPIFFINVTIRECNFAMGTISGMGFTQALVHTSQHLCLCKTHSRDYRHGEIRHSLFFLQIKLITNSISFLYFKNALFTILGHSLHWLVT